jgi:hypothetical protein
MTILNSKFDVISRDPHPNAGGSLFTVLSVAGAPGPYSSPSGSGTPVAGDIFAGAIVVMNNVGKAVLADSATTATSAQFRFPLVAVDGDQDYDGALIHTISCIQGGAEFRLDGSKNFAAAAYNPGDLLTWGTAATAGKFIAATTGAQIYGVVGPEGYNASQDTLHIIVPQGIQPKAL